MILGSGRYRRLELAQVQLGVGGFPGGFELGIGPGGVGFAVLGFEGLGQAEQGAGIARVANEIFAEDFFGFGGIAGG